VWVKSQHTPHRIPAQVVSWSKNRKKKAGGVRIAEENQPLCGEVFLSAA
jgi:hypothetical protein